MERKANWLISQSGLLLVVLEDKGSSGCLRNLSEKWQILIVLSFKSTNLQETCCDAAPLSQVDILFSRPYKRCVILLSLSLMKPWTLSLHLPPLSICHPFSISGHWSVTAVGLTDPFYPRRDCSWVAPSPSPPTGPFHKPQWMLGL